MPERVLVKYFLAGGIAIIIVCCTLVLLAAAPTLAAPSLVTFTVDNKNDLVDGDTTDGVCTPGSCSLRAAIMQANKIIGHDVTIIVPSGIYTLTHAPAGDDSDNSGDLNLNGPPSGNWIINIVGAGAVTTIIDGNQLDRVLSVALTRTASISGLTVRDGLPGAFQRGGGIYNLGTLSLLQNTLTGNRAYDGGAVYNNGNLSISQSTLVQNNASNYGGGIYNDKTITLTHSIVSTNTADFGGAILNARLATVIDSTLSGNDAGHDGGGIWNVTTLVVINSTLSGNNAGQNGGGIYNADLTTNVYNSTIALNQAGVNEMLGGSGAGIYHNAVPSSSVVNLRNTLLAGNNLDTAPIYDDCYGELHSYGANLIGTSASTVNCTVTIGSGTWNYLNSLSLLGGLQNNGGPTWTHALKPGSNAIDGGDPVSGCLGPAGTLSVDQRGATRPIDGDRNGSAICDIGAFEYRPPLYLPMIRR